MVEPQLPPRPDPPRHAADVARRWLAWFGLGRLVLTAASVVVVVAGLSWLVRTEPPPVEATLPMATTSVPSTGPPTTGDRVPDRLLVHVAGAVVAPGVYQLDTGARVDDAVRSAGGPVADAELDGLNLAAPLVDGQRVYVPVVGEIDPATVPSGVAPVDGVVTPVDLNSATVEQLDSLPGIGPATAAAIVDDRDRNGPFSSVDDLERVPGIGPAKLAALLELVTV